MNEKIKVLYTSEFGSLTGGGQQSILLILGRLNRDKYQPILISREDGHLPMEAEAMGILTIVKAPCRLRSLNIIQMWKTFTALKELVKTQEIKLIHTDSPRWTFYLGFIAKFLKIPLIYHVRVGTPEPKLYEQVTYSVSAKIIAVSNAVKKRFRNFSKSDQKVNMIYNAVDTQKFTPQCQGSLLRSELGVGENILVGMIGQLTPNKGQREFLQAAAKVHQEHPHVKFVMIGDEDGVFRSELENLIRQLALERFVTIGISRRDMPETMAALDILVNASHLEGFSRVIIEGMASGKAIIATEVGGNPEAVENNETGILVSSKNPKQLADAIITFVKDEQLRNKMGLAGRKRVEENFSIDHQIKKIESIYEQLVRDK